MMKLALAIVMVTLLAAANIAPRVAKAQFYIVELSLGNDPVQAGTGTSITVSIDDDWIYDTYNSSSSAFFLRAWVYRTDSIGTREPVCHGGSWPNGRSITPISDGNRLVITTRISGSCPPREESGYTVRLDVMATIDGTDTVVANRAVDFTVTGAPPTATATATPTATRTLTATATPTPTESPAATYTPTATATPDNSVANPPQQPRRKPTGRPTHRPTATPTLTLTATVTREQTSTEAESVPLSPQSSSQPLSVTETPAPVLPTSVSLEITFEPPDGTPTSGTSKPKPPPPTTCIVAHAATPVQVCRDNKTGGLHFHFVGETDVFSGPIFPSIAEISSDYPTGYIPTEVELYRGISTGTGKEVLVHFVADRGYLRVATYYADSEYDTDKPYVFSISRDGTVTHLAW